VFACETWGSDARRSAVVSATVRFGSVTSIALAPVCGSRLSSRNVATDSTFGFRRCSGLKSNGRNNRSGEAKVTKTRVVTITGTRNRWINRSTGASAAKPMGAAHRADVAHSTAPATR
jgi:hypothetical protein